MQGFWTHITICEGDVHGYGVTLVSPNPESMAASKYVQSPKGTGGGSSETDDRLVGKREHGFVAWSGAYEATREVDTKHTAVLTWANVIKV